MPISGVSINRISRFRVINHTVFKDSGDIKLNDVTVLTGKNNIGKSAVLSAIYLLSKYGTENKEFYQILRRPNVDNFIILQYELELALEFDEKSLKEKIHSAKKDLKPEDFSKCDELIHKIETKQISIFIEFFHLGNKTVIQKFSVSGFIYHLEERRGILYSPVTSDQYVLNVFVNDLILNPLIRILSSHAYMIFYFNPHRVVSVEEEWSELSLGDKLTSNADNLKSFLHKLNSNDRKKYKSIESHMKRAFPEIEEIITPISQISDKAGILNHTDIRFKFKYYTPENYNETISLKYCGTGIEQYLAIATAIITAEYPTLFLIDEPHAFLHPFAEKKLLELIEEYPQHQYVISTHSPAILNFICSESIRLLKRIEDGSVSYTEYNVESVISELGLRPSDLWFYEKILFVEGQTEEKVIPIILSKVFSKLKLNKIKIAG